MPTSRSAAGAPNPGRPKRAARRAASPRTVPRASAPVVLPPEPRPEFVYLSPGKRVVRAEPRAATRRARVTASGDRRPTGRPDRPARGAGRDAGARARAIRYGRMLVSPFTFFRGAALIMAADLAPTPNSGITVQLCGDAARLQLRRVRFARASADLRHQRLRRDLARAVGVGPQAPYGQPRDRRSRPRFRRCRSPRRRPGGGREYRDIMRQAADMPALDVW